MIVPVYVAEASPPLIRGRLVGIYEVFVSAGTMLGFWINYGLAKNVSPSSKQWIISFAVQLIPGSLLLIGTFFIPESPRYLAQRKGRDKCIASLQRLRCIPSDHPYLLEEVHSIFQQIEHEEAIAEGNGIKTFLKELTKTGNIRRLLIGCLMFIFMQMAGSNAINYYSPAIFKSIGLTGSNTAFFATGIYGVVRFVAIIFAMVFVVDRFGRTRTLMVGSVVMVSKSTWRFMSFCLSSFFYNQRQRRKTFGLKIMQAFAMWYIGAYVKIASPGSGGSSGVSSAGYVGIAMIYIYAIGWCFSWAGIPWIYASEIFPLRIRSPCVSICIAVHWILNFVIARSVPYMISNIGYGTYFLFAAFITISVPWVFFFVPETKGLSLEDMDALFGLPQIEHLYHDNDNTLKEPECNVTHSEHSKA